MAMQGEGFGAGSPKNDKSDAVNGQSGVPAVKRKMIAVPWTREEQAILEEAFPIWCSEPNLILRYARIAVLFKKKTVRDVALRCRWMKNRSAGAQKKDLVKVKEETVEIKEETVEIKEETEEVNEETVEIKEETEEVNEETVEIKEETEEVKEETVEIKEEIVEVKEEIVEVKEENVEVKEEIKGEDESS